MPSTERHSRPPDSQDPAVQPSRLGWWIRMVAPWVGAFAILAYLFHEIPFEDVWEAGRRAQLGLFVPEVLVAVGVWFALDSRALAYLFSRLNAPLSWAEARSLRGMTYLVSAIQWNVGTAAMILHLRRSKKIPALESTGSLLFYQSIDTLILVGLTLVGSIAFTESELIHAIRLLAALAFGLQLLALVLLLGSRPCWRWLERVRGWSIVRSFRLVEPRDLLVLVAFRLSYFLCSILLFWVTGQAFGISIPPLLALASVPPILMFAALPITPAGLGTQAATMLFFWSEYGGRAEILALGLLLPLAVALSRCLVGLVYLGDLKALRRPAPLSPE